MKKWILCLLCLALLSPVGDLSVYATGGAGWYVKRNDQHKQPTLDTAQQVIEKYDGYYIDKKHGDDCKEKVLYLTFDAGYENGNVAKILDVLQEEQVPAAFFILKQLLEHDLPLVERMAEEGHLVCNHTLHHKNMAGCTGEVFRAETAGLETLYHEKTGKMMAPYFRPPEGRYDATMLSCAQAAGYKTIFWSFAYADWDNDKQPTADAARKKIVENTHNGAVILLHPTSATNAAILKELIAAWRAMGYRFGTLDELVTQAGDTL